MSWEAAGAIGEILGALGVIATLGYLAVQIRQNTRSLRANAYQSTVDSANEWAAFFVHHPETIELFRKGLSEPSQLDRAQAVEFSHLLEVMFRNYTAARKLAEEGLVPEHICVAYENNLRRWFDGTSLREWWNPRDPKIVEVIETLVGGPGAK